MDCLRRFLARIFRTDFLRFFLHGFFVRIFAQIFARFLSKDLCTDFFARCPKPLVGKRQNLTEKIPKKFPKNFTMLWGPSGGEVETLANLTKARVFED